MHQIKSHLKTLEDFMRVAKESKLNNDYEKIKKKYLQIKRGVRCLTVAELKELKSLELFTSPYNQDQLQMIQIAIEKQ